MQRFARSLFALVVTVGSESAHAIIEPEFEIICHTTSGSEEALKVEVNLTQRHTHPMAGPSLFGGVRITGSGPQPLYELFPVLAGFRYRVLSITGTGGFDEPLAYMIQATGDLFYNGEHSDILLKVTNTPPMSPPVTRTMTMNCTTTDLRRP